LGQGSEFLRAFMASTMGAKQSSVKGDLDGVADEPYADSGSDEAIADAVAGSGEADRSILVDDPQHLCPFGRLGRTRHLDAAIHLVVVDEVTTGVRRDYHAVV
jgi:hypothetical protein